MKRALLSVFDKTGITEFAKSLRELDYEIISTGGTAKNIRDENIEVTDITEVTSFPECFDGRVKTLNPKIFGGILAQRDNINHRKMMDELDITPIDIIAVNLYPFKETLDKKNVSHEEIIENIDIGGPSMIRAAAKNFQDVTVIIDPKDYSIIIEEMKTQGEISQQSRLYLAAKVFQYTAHYDALIANYFNQITKTYTPEKLTITYLRNKELRYGENPHQKAAFYTEINQTEGTLADARQLHGKDLSFNNINDTNGALEILKEYEEPTIVAVKHGNPCGIGSADTIAKAYERAYEADKTSIYGGIIAANRRIDEATAQMIGQIFIEVVVAPGYTDEAIKILTTKKNIRILHLEKIKKNDYKHYVTRTVLGGLLLQERDALLLKDELKIATKREPTEAEMQDLLFAWKAVKHTKSNAIVLAKDKTTVAVGPGQVSRIWALENCIKQGENRVEGSVLASDAFFPFKDSVETAAKAGITAIIQPGGSIRDNESIEAANKHNIAMVFTGIRHFKH